MTNQRESGFFTFLLPILSKINVFSPFVLYRAANEIMRTMHTPQLDITEDFARFFESPSREKLRELLRKRTGEYDFLDFKEAWPERSELARHVLAFANSGNGCIVVGVAESSDGTFDVKGLQSIEDKTLLKESIAKYLPDAVSFEIHDFEYRESEYAAIKGKSFQVLFAVHNPLSVPMLACAEGTSLKRNRIYVRTDGSSTEADHVAVQKLIEKRLEASAGPAPEQIHNLKQHLSELHALYEYKLPDLVSFAYTGPFSAQAGFYRFIERMIATKEEVIQRLIS
jgi:hypothetical protein